MNAFCAVPADAQPLTTLPTGEEVYKVSGGVPDGTTIFVSSPTTRVFEQLQVGDAGLELSLGI
jgi:hypothetical protein